MFIYLYVYAIFFSIIALYCFVASFFDKSKDRISACYAHIGNFSLAHSALAQRCARLENIKSVTRHNAIVGRNALPRDPKAKHHWGEPFSVYTSPGGRKLHLQYGCCGATHVQHLYTLSAKELDEENFCSKCNKSLRPDSLPFLRLYCECRYYLRKENTTCNLLKCQIAKCEKGLTRILYRREIRHIKSDYQKMLADREAIQNKLCIQFRKGYLGLRGAGFYRVCQSKHPGASANSKASCIAALRPVSDDPKKYEILRLGFPNGGYILYKEGTYITAGKEIRLLGIKDAERYNRYVYLSPDSVNLLSPGE